MVLPILTLGLIELKKILPESNNTGFQISMSC